MVSLVSAMSSVFILILPESRQKKAFSTFSIVVLVFSLIYPMSKSPEKSFDFSDIFSLLENKSIEDEIIESENYLLLSAVSSETIEYLEKSFSEYGIECKCEVDCIYEKDTILIKSISVNGDFSAEQNSIIAFEIYEVAGEKVEIVINGEIYE